MSVDRRQSVERRRNENATERVTRMAVLERTAPGISLHPAEKILRYSIKWLTKRGTRTVSKHIARHARRIAGRAIHSVFKHPRHIKSMIESTVKEAVELAAKHAKKPVQEAIEDGAIKITQQATGTPGKVRWIVEKTFRQAIGTQGERILRIVVDQSGRIVSAFPTDRLIAIGLGVGAVGILGERSADAAERARGHAERDASQENDSSWLDFVPFIGDVWSGNLNSGEAEELRLRDELERDIREVVAAIEAEEKRKLTADERRLVEETFRAAVAAPLLHESDDEESL
jgi:histone H3/H4